MACKFFPTPNPSPAWQTPLEAPFPLCSNMLNSRGHEAENAFWIWPFSAPLLFENETSDARDHCANERSAPEPFPSSWPALLSPSGSG